MKTVIAAFRDRYMADQAIESLGTLNLSETNIRFLEGADSLQGLKGTRIPEDRQNLYAEVVRRGAPVILIDCEDDQAERVAALLDERGSLDLDAAAERWRTAGWQGYSQGAQPFDAESAAMEREALERESLAVIQEEVRVGKREVEGGGVRVRTFVTEHPVQQTVDLREERVDVTREKVDEPVPIQTDAGTFTEEEYVVTATSEEPVVQKQARVVERVNVEKSIDSHAETIEETERRRDVQVDPLRPDPNRR